MNYMRILQGADVEQKKASLVHGVRENQRMSMRIDLGLEFL